MDSEPRVRRVQLPADVRVLQALDTAMSADEVYLVEELDMGFRLLRQALPTPLHKMFGEFREELDDHDRPWSDAWIAEGDSEAIGFASVSFESWNRRLRLWHLYTDRQHRRRGVARSLLAAVFAHAHSVEASHVFVETPNVNASAIDAYMALGFRLVGLDRSLYSGTAARAESAVYLSHGMI